MSESPPPLMDQRSFAKGEVIFKDGDEGTCAYVVENGCIEISKDADGHKVVLGMIRDAGMFGEMALIDNAPRMATATAIEASTCFVIRKEEFKEHLMDANPFIILLMHMLIKNVRSVSDQLIEYVAETDKILEA